MFGEVPRVELGMNFRQEVVLRAVRTHSVQSEHDQGRARVVGVFKIR